MPLSFAGRLASLAALVGFVVVALLAGAGYTLVSTIRVGNEALSTYTDELLLAWQLQEAHERKLASGRGFLVRRDDVLMVEFETAATDAQAALSRLRERVTSAEGIALLDVVGVTYREHDRALREVMQQPGTAEETRHVWLSEVMPKATRARAAMDAFIAHKQKLHHEAKARVLHAQQRAGWVMGMTALGALILAVLGGGGLLRSAQRAYAAEQHARTAAEAERRFFFELIDQLPIGVIAADAKGKILHVSGFARALLESDRIPPQGAQQIADYVTWPASRADGTRYAPHELPLARACRGELVTQEEMWSHTGRVYSATAGPVRDQSGAIVAAVSTFTDISERKRGERERELFIGALGHDLRNPLQAISLAAGTLLRRDDVPEVAKTPATRIANSADRMGRLIGDLLDFAVSRHGAIPLNPEACELRDIAADVIAEIKAARPDANIQMEEQGGCDGRFDRARMGQVFQNLLVNAVDHGDPRAPITVRTGCDAGHVWAEVRNRGAIPSAERERLFEPFKAQGASKGLGLGLYIARAIVEAHGGSIAVDSSSTETTFRLRLPTHVPSSAPREARSPPGHWHVP